MITQLLEQAIEKLKSLPKNQQNKIAGMILEEIEDEVKWNQAFTHSQNALAKLAAAALEEYRAGKTQELDSETF